MASSQVRPSPERLAGGWVISAQKNHCEVRLSAEWLPAFNGYSLSGDATCLSLLFTEIPIAWRSEPDGIALLNGKGMIIEFFSANGQTYQSQIWQTNGKTLSKSA